MKRPKLPQYSYESLPQPSASTDDLDDDLPLYDEFEQDPASTATNHKHMFKNKRNKNKDSIQQTSFQIDTLTSKKARNRTLFTITQVGTKSSRSGYYIRPSWKSTIVKHFKERYRSYIILFLTIFLLRPMLLKKNSSSSSSTQDLPQEEYNDDRISFRQNDYQSFSPQKEMHDRTNLCIDSASNTCHCTNPLQGLRNPFENWQKVHGLNLELARKGWYDGKKYDVTFLGDSIVEEMNGRMMGVSLARLDDLNSVFKDLFDSSSHKDETDGKSAMSLANLDGLALGIAGDRIPNLLWRLQDGQELEHVDSKVYWLVIGTNDLSISCSEEVILLGIVHLVEIIQKLKPDAIVVINSILPRTDDETGKLVPSSSSVNGQSSDIIVSSTDLTNQEQVNATRTKTNVDSSGKGHPINQADNLFLNDDDANENADGSSHRVLRKSSSREAYQKQHYYWTSIQSINHGLRHYAEAHQQVEFFDASEIFVASLGNRFYQRKEEFILKELQKDYLHPTALGQRLWLEAIVDYMISDLDTPTNLREFA